MFIDYLAGESAESIAQRYAISPARIYQILNKELSNLIVFDSVNGMRLDRFKYKKLEDFRIKTSGNGRLLLAVAAQRERAKRHKPEKNTPEYFYLHERKLTTMYQRYWN